MKFPFMESENTAIITCCHVIENGADILYVSHDAEDSVWQFLCGETHIQEEARVISLNEIVTLDNTLSDLARLPCGYIAERKNISSKWKIKKK